MRAIPAVARYERIRSWWIRRDDEIGFVASGPIENLAVEIKNRELSLKEARPILSTLEQKIPLVKNITVPVTLEKEAVITIGILQAFPGTPEFFPPQFSRTFF